MKAVTKLTGITPDTLRAWERRHFAVDPEREPNGRRMYTEDDIVRLRLLKQATQLGHPISKIASLSNLELKQRIAEKSQDAEFARLSGLTEKLIKAIQNYQVDVCDEVLGLAAAGLSPIDYSKKVLAPTLVEVGDLWHRGIINSAQEHLLTSCIKRHVFSLIQIYRHQASQPRLVFSTLSQDHHELGILMCCLIAACQGFRCYYLGPDLPHRDLVHAVLTIAPAALALSITQSPKIRPFMRELGQLCKEIPASCEIWIGGAGIAQIDHSRLTHQCKVLATLDDFSEQLNYLRVKGKNFHTV